MQSSTSNLNYKNIQVVPSNWQSLSDEELSLSDFYISYTFISDSDEEHLMSIYPYSHNDIAIKKKEIFNIIQILPFKLNAGFNPLVDDYYDFKGLFINYYAQITPATENMNNGSVSIKLSYVNPSEYIFSLNDIYSNNPFFENLENGTYELKIIHIITNQILKTTIILKPVSPTSFSSDYNVLDSFKNAIPYINGSDEFKSTLENVMKRIYTSIIKLNFQHKKISEIRKNDLKLMIDYLHAPAHVYNKARSYISLVYNVLIEFEAVDQNVARNILKQKTIIRLRKIIPDQELENIFEFLKCHYYAFYRYTKIFYYSGSRSSELFALKVKDVNLENREFKIVIKKGKSHHEVIKAISPDVIELWKEVIAESNDRNDILFSHGYLPGRIAINPRINSANWQYYIQKKLNVTYHFYSLKHKYLDLLDQYQNLVTFKNENIASVHASHTTTKITDKHYLINKKNRQIEALKQFSLENLKI